MRKSQQLELHCIKKLCSSSLELFKILHTIQVSPHQKMRTTRRNHPGFLIVAPHSRVAAACQLYDAGDSEYAGMRTCRMLCVAQSSPSGL